jgi:hypothetical protein
MAKTRLFAEIFGLVVRLLGLWIVYQGFVLGQTAIMVTMIRGGNAESLMAGVLTAIVGLGVLRYADTVVRFSYRDRGLYSEPAE